MVGHIVVILYFVNREFLLQISVVCFYVGCLVSLLLRITAGAVEVLHCSIHECHINYH